MILHAIAGRGFLAGLGSVRTLQWLHSIVRTSRTGISPTAVTIAKPRNTSCSANARALACVHLAVNACDCLTALIVRAAHVS